MKEETTTQAETRPLGIVSDATTQTTPEQPTLPGMETQGETRPLGSVSKAADQLAVENESLRSELRMRSAVYAIETRLATAGARSPGLLAEQSKARLQFTEEGELANPEAVIEHLRRTWPDQFTPDPVPSIDASAGRTVGPTLTKEALARMTPAEIQRLDWAEVKAALAS